MYSRSIRIALRVDSAPEFKRLFESKIIPLLRQQRGFLDEISFIAPERNEALAISFWDKQENADAYNHTAYLDVLRILSTVVAGMPIMDKFEVVTSSFRRLAASPDIL